jgi:SAM-dependent MidA family methyltransferase
LGARLRTATPGTIAEVSPARSELVHAIARRIAGAGGLALVIDYGAWAEGPTGDTLQATRQHAACDPLDAPGTADLTTHVDFRALAEAAAGGGAAVYGPVPQGAFLATLGVHLRTAKLLERATPDQRHALRAALFRLTDPGAMGELFKVLVLAHPAAPAPPGFDAPTLRPC